MSKKKDRAKYKKLEEENKEFMSRFDKKNWAYIEKKIKEKRGW